MALSTRITLPPSGRPVGGLLGAARPIPTDEWWRGVSFASAQCVPPQTIGTCTDGEVDKVPQSLSTEATFDVFALIVSLECSTMNQTDLATFAEQSLDVVREFALARELLTGEASGNPSLADATVSLSVPSDPATALGCLEAEAAEELSGRLAFIHVSPQIGGALFAASSIYRDGRIWYTPAGNIVVISPGYDGRTPGAGAPVGGESLFMYATGEVYAAVGQRQAIGAVERTQNTSQAIAEDAGIAVFDPCFNIAIDSGLSACIDIVS